MTLPAVRAEERQIIEIIATKWVPAVRSRLTREYGKDWLAGALESYIRRGPIETQKVIQAAESGDQLSDLSCKKGGMRRLAEAGNTAHELMAISGHKTLSEVQRYTEAADKKRLADSGMAKARGQSENSNVTNTATLLHKHAAKALKAKV